MNATLNLIDAEQYKIIDYINFKQDFINSWESKFCRLQYLYYLSDINMIICTG